MRNDYRGRMGVWLKALLIFVVFNKVHLYRQLMNTTCLELAKPSNKQLRLSCNNTSIYHCLLNGDSTKEFEICKMWKWIPEGNCAYLNTYGGNIDARSCSSAAELACPTKLYRSEDTIKYAACYIKKNTNSTARQVRNTTCLELAKPSNLQFRMSCNNTGTYHCLLDQSNSKEYEICMMWKWIPEGKCAYFNMYSGSNIDERNCTSSSHFVCPEKQYQSENTTNYSACYIRNKPTTIRPLTSLSPTASNWTSSDGNGGNATSSRISDTAEKHIEMKADALPTILGIIVPLVSIAVIYFILMHLKYVPLYRKLKLKYALSGIPAESQESNDRARNNDNIEHQPCMRIEVEDTSGGPPTMRHEDENTTGARRSGFSVESQELGDKVRDEDTIEHQPFLMNDVENTSGSPPTMRHEEENITEARMNEIMRHEDENITEGRRNVYHVKSQESSNRVKNEDSVEQQPFLGRIEMDITSENSSTMKHGNEDNLSEARWNGNSGADDLDDLMDESDVAKHYEDVSSPNARKTQRNYRLADDGKEEEKEEKSADSIPGSCSVSEKLDNEREDEEKSTDVFDVDDTVESLLRIAPPSDEQGRKLCSELYNLLDTEGLKLTERVMTASITRMTGKSMKNLIDNLTDREKNKLKEVMPENSHRIIDSKREHGTSFILSYSLHRIYIDKDQSPKSGWGNPVRGKDTGIGDDIERLNRICSIVCGISNPATVSVEYYIRLLDIMIKALIRLDHGAEFKEDYEALANKLTSIKNPTLTQTLIKTIQEFFKLW